MKAQRKSHRRTSSLSDDESSELDSLCDFQEFVLSALPRKTSTRGLHRRLKQKPSSYMQPPWMTQYKKVASRGRAPTNDAGGKNLPCMPDSMSPLEMAGRDAGVANCHSICQHDSRAMQRILSAVADSSAKNTGGHLSSTGPGVNIIEGHKIVKLPNPVQVLAIGRSRRRKKHREKHIQDHQITFNQVALAVTNKPPDIVGGRSMDRKQRLKKVRRSFVQKRDGGIKAQTQPKRMVRVLLPSIDGTRSIPRLLKDEESRRRSVERVLRNLGVMKHPLGTSRRASMPSQDTQSNFQ